MNHFGQLLVSNDYLRERLDPRPGDRCYLHLSDLLIGMQKVVPQHPGRVLDLGAGGSPYRSLFAGADYKRADVPGVPDLDYIIDEATGLVSAPDGSFDCVLSSQVLEHVPDPVVYLNEALRVLRPGGHLILSTHGIWEDHPCPFDFWRWTYAGIEKLLVDAGFQIEEGYKLSNGPRAAMALLEGNFGAAPRRNLYGWCVWPFRWFARTKKQLFHKALDSVNVAQRLVPGSDDKGKLYLALLFSASKK